MRPGALGAWALSFALSRTSLAEAPATAEITVQGARRSAPSELALSGETARQGAGTQGDPAKALQSLPGIGRGGVGGELVMWGSEPRESRIEVDGVPIPVLYHGSGVRSVVPADVIEAVRSVPGAYGAEHGRALGGLVELDTRSADSSAPRLSAHADLLDASVSASMPWHGRNGAAEASFRYGYVDRWLPPLIAPELRGLYRVPAYWDARAELSHAVQAGETVRLVLLTSSDSSQSQQLSADAARHTLARSAQQFGRIYLQYHNLSRPDLETSLTPFVGFDAASQTLAVGQQSSGVETSALRFGLRARHRAQLDPHVVLTLGVDGEGTLAHVERRGSPSVPRREGDPYPFGTPPGTSLASDTFRAHVLSVAPFVEAELRVTPSLTLTPSLRIEPTLLETNRAHPPLGELPDLGKSQLSAGLEPRFTVEQRLARAVRLFGSVGRYHQPPDVADLSARFGNPGLGLAAATHVSVGESVTVGSRTRVEVLLFGKWLNGLATRATDPQPENAQSLVATGRGRAFGSQLLLRQAEVGGLSGWLSATLSRSERQGDDGQRRLSDFDSPLVLAASLLQKLGAFRVGARARFASGTPRTPVIGAYYDLASQRYQPLLAPTNSARLRDFFQFDLRIDQRFQLGTTTTLELYVDAMNVTARVNQEQWAYSSDFTRVGSVSGLPPLAILGVTVER